MQDSCVNCMKFLFHRHDSLIVLRVQNYTILNFNTNLKFNLSYFYYLITSDLDIIILMKSNYEYRN